MKRSESSRSEAGSEIKRALPSHSVFGRPAPLSIFASYAAHPPSLVICAPLPPVVSLEEDAVYRLTVHWLSLRLLQSPR